MKTGWMAGIAAMIVTAALALPVVAAEKKQVKGHSTEDVKKDIADHRAMADAHLNAARCFESGRSEKECHAQLAKDCKGLAIGKYCGMKHQH